MEFIPFKHAIISAEDLFNLTASAEERVGLLSGFWEIWIEEEILIEACEGVWFDGAPAPEG